MKITGEELAQRVARLHPKMTKYLFAYADAADTRKKLSRIKVYFLLYEPGAGNGFYDFVYYLAAGRTAKQWAEHLKEKGIAAFATRFLSSVNVKKRRDWRLVKMLCFTKYTRSSGRRKGTRV